MSRGAVQLILFIRWAVVEFIIFNSSRREFKNVNTQTPHLIYFLPKIKFYGAKNSLASLTELYWLWSLFLYCE